MAEVIRAGDQTTSATADERPLQLTAVRDGIATMTFGLDQARERCRASIAELPIEALKLSPGDPVIDTVFEVDDAIRQA